MIPVRLKANPNFCLNFTQKRAKTRAETGKPREYPG
jgi:hypothetical protein